MSVDDNSRPAAALTGARAITARRLVFGLAAVAIWVGLTALFAASLAPGGLDAVDIAILVLFAIALPWSTFGFLNAAIGFLIMRFAADPLALTCPPAAAIRGDEPITARVALLMCVRNEDTARVFRNLSLMLDDIAADGAGGAFEVYVLSDSNRPDTAAAENLAFAALQRRFAGRIRGLTYRRRLENPGFKAGNIRDFCQRWGAGHDFMLVLDADSFMASAQILTMVRIMQTAPRLGILQSLTVGLPSTSPLARIFQFGMRLGMRSYTLGSAWWQADCGPYWGHNALIRVAPFIKDCDMPRLPGVPPWGGDIMSHDQVEAVLMRRAGYEVRVIPFEGGSFEENPPTMIEFIRRDMRWCLGNMQYVRLVGLPGIRPTSRFQLVLAIAMFLSSPAFLAMWALLLLQGFRHAGGDWFAPRAGQLLIALVAFMVFAPKIAAALDVLAKREARASFGGTGRFLASLAVETVFTLLLTPISQAAHTMTLVALSFGRTVGWTAQVREAHSLPWSDAFARLWPQTLIGLCAGLGLLWFSVGAFVYASPVFLGALLAVPYAVMTAHPGLGRWMTRIGLCRIPEEVSVPAEIAPMGLPALAGRA